MYRRKRWRTILWSGSPWAPVGPHVYVIYFDGVLGYIGSSQDLLRRFGRYCFKKEPSGEWSCLIRGTLYFARSITIKIKKTTRFGQWLMDEARLINRLCPQHNRRLVRGKKGGASCPT